MSNMNVNPDKHFDNSDPIEQNDELIPFNTEESLSHSTDREDACCINDEEDVLNCEIRFESLASDDLEESDQEEGCSNCCCQMSHHENFESLEESHELMNQSSDSQQQKKDFSRQNGPNFQSLLSEMENSLDVEGKLRKVIEFMEESLAQNTSPHFKNFWEARKLCLQLFKETVPPLVRGQLWARYSELSKEARRLKEILDEQSAFAVEQIEIAIQGLEADIEHFEAQLEKVTHLHFSSPAKTLDAHYPYYDKLQRELNLLNAH